MAAGLGSRFGGIKQIAPIDKENNIIIDYSIYDALAAGFDKVIFVISRKIEEPFCERIFNRIKNKINAKYVFQDLDDLPGGFKTPEGRIKPWGTTQAILAARNEITEPFCAINADDFYSREAYVKIAKFLQSETDIRASRASEYGKRTLHAAMVSYNLGNTSTKVGSFTRGICTAENGMIKSIDERTQIEVRNGKIGWVEGDKFNVLSKKTLVSMNFWALTPDIMPMLEKKFACFLKDNITKEKAEYPIPVALDELLKENKITIKMETTNEQWLGITYKEDLPSVSVGIAKLIKKKIYPSPLWSK
jgi:dTDP-glucose pyrophosphorylase